jgi:L-amino acid N-acyltransferase YncA
MPTGAAQRADPPATRLGPVVSIPPQPGSRPTTAQNHHSHPAPTSKGSRLTAKPNPRSAHRADFPDFQGKSAHNEGKPTISPQSRLTRSADPARDGAACAAIYHGFVRDTVISLEETPPDTAEMADRIRRITRTHPWLVAEDDGRVVGFAYASPHRERASYRWATDVTVYIEPESHRRGIGRALYSTLFDMLRAQGLLMACAGITLPNDASVALHESFGFVPVGVYRRIGYKHGAWRDVGWWQLELARTAGEPPPEPTPPN